MDFSDSDAVNCFEDTDVAQIFTFYKEDNNEDFPKLHRTYTFKGV